MTRTRSSYGDCSGEGDTDGVCRRLQWKDINVKKMGVEVNDGKVLREMNGDRKDDRMHEKMTVVIACIDLIEAKH